MYIPVIHTASLIHHEIAEAKGSVEIGHRRSRQGEVEKPLQIAYFKD